MEILIFLALPIALLYIAVRDLSFRKKFHYHCWHKIPGSNFEELDTKCREKVAPLVFYLRKVRCCICGKEKTVKRKEK